MLRNWIHQARAFIESHWQKFNAYLENERSREISHDLLSKSENDETAMFLFVLVIVWLIAFEISKRR